MSAVEEYRDGVHTDDWSDVVCKRLADAAIAELEAEKEGWERSHKVWCDDLANIDKLKQRAEQAEAALAERDRITATFVLDCISDEDENLTYHGVDYVKWDDVKETVQSCMSLRARAEEGSGG